MLPQEHAIYALLPFSTEILTEESLFVMKRKPMQYQYHYQLTEAVLNLFDLGIPLYSYMLMRIPKSFFIYVSYICWYSPYYKYKTEKILKYLLIH